MDETPRKIEIFAPFAAALDLTKLILFQPFDISKWLVIGFAAFLANLSGGGGASYFKRLPKGNWSWRSTSHDFANTSSDWPGWVWPLIIIGALLIFALIIALLWVGSRGKFIFADCIVRNRAAIVAPWKEFRREGNSYFLFRLLASVILLFVLGLAGAPLWIPLALHGELPKGIALVFGVSFLGLIALIAVAALALISQFMLPVMYRQRCNATKGLSEACATITRHLGPVMLYLLFSIVLGLAFVLVACLLTCVTCCIVALPYVGTVILLPVYVFFMGYLLLFVRQFGPDYDAWANILPIEAPLPPIATSVGEPPPMQT